MAVHGVDFVCLSDDDGLKHIDSLLKSKNTAEDMGTLGFGDSDVKSLLLLNRARAPFAHHQVPRSLGKEVVRSFRTRALGEQVDVFQCVIARFPSASSRGSCCT